MNLVTIRRITNINIVSNFPKITTAIPAVRVSIVGFDDDTQKSRALDGQTVSAINSDLTYSADLTTVVPLPENQNLCMRTDEKGGPFDINDDLARKMLMAANPDGKPNSDVVFPWVNGMDIVRRNRRMWIIDLGVFHCDPGSCKASSFCVAKCPNYA